jgi:hypothetical protein
MLPYPTAALPCGVPREGARLPYGAGLAACDRKSAPRTRRGADTTAAAAWSVSGQQLPCAVYRYQYLTPRWCEHVPRAWAL